MLSSTFMEVTSRRQIKNSSANILCSVAKMPDLDLLKVSVGKYFLKLMPTHHSEMCRYATVISATVTGFACDRISPEHRSDRCTWRCSGSRSTGARLQRSSPTMRSAWRMMAVCERRKKGRFASCDTLERLYSVTRHARAALQRNTTRSSGFAAKHFLEYESKHSGCCFNPARATLTVDSMVLHAAFMPPLTA